MPSQLQEHYERSASGTEEEHSNEEQEMKSVEGFKDDDNGDYSKVQMTNHENEDVTGSIHNLHAATFATSSTDQESLYATLRRDLSMESLVATTSSTMKCMETAKPFQGGPLAVIGRGTCGTVFEIPSTEVALKKGSNKDGLWTDANLTNTAHLAVIESKARLESVFPHLSIPRVPKVLGWLGEDEMDSWWKEHQEIFPKDPVGCREPMHDSKPGYVFYAQRIPSLPSSSREGLIKAYFPPMLVNEALRNPANRACLVRPYIGQRRGQRELNAPPTTLENFPMYLDQLAEVLNVRLFAKEMAMGLAIVHWKAMIDGMDIEFVLGSATTDLDTPAIIPNFQSVRPFSVPASDSRRRQVHLWILDFDKAKLLDIFGDWEKSCAQMVAAVTSNDSYYPNPSAVGALEEEAWNEFEEVYVKAAVTLLKFHPKSDGAEKLERYPKQFISAWKKRAAEQAKDQDGGFIVFED
ncbi:hypothetical protein N0V94_004850 [Neodidymelliopsis sp. IMI 364377]|nr:hypothetical protein N0V94_004850 [Neodidymelliopsis sp. IMI 364377]